MAKGWFKSLKRSLKAGKQQSDCRLLEELVAKALQVNSDAIPVLVISYNNGVYARNIVSQLNRFDITPIIIDNSSDDPDTLRTLGEMESEKLAQVVYSDKNFGHMVGFLEPIYKLLPDVFAYTDPDLEFSEDLPDNFLSVLSELTVQYSVFKAGFALDLMEGSPSADITTRKSKSKPFPYERTFTFREWESQFWRMRLAHDSLEVYAAKLDTTLAVYRKGNYQGDFLDGVRVAGNYSAIHLPWFPSLDIMSEGERVNYLRKNKSTSWVST